MLGPRCSTVLDKKAAKNTESAHKANEMGNKKKDMPQYCFNKREVPQRKEHTSGPQKVKPNTYKPTTNAPQRKWTKPTEREHHRNLKWRNFKIG